jgi:glycosyltransferase involved in cell wall biosynthesis
MTWMKKVLLLSREFPPSLGGSGIAVYNYIRNIKGYCFDVLSFFDPTYATENIRIRKVDNHFFGHRYTSAAQYVLYSLAGAFGSYDLIIGNAFIGGACGVLVKALSGKPLISIVHDVDYLYSPECKYNWLNKAVRKYMYNRIFSDSDVIMIPNPVIKKEILKIFGRKAANKVRTILLGVDVEGFEKIPRPRNKKVILFVGAIRRNKGIEYLIDAFNEVALKFSASELWIAGTIMDKEYYEELKKQSAKLGIRTKVKFLGPVKHYEKGNVVGYTDVGDKAASGARVNIFSYYDACDVFAIASYHSERFGIPCVEAELMGKPVVATDIFEENGVVVDGKTAIVVPRQDSKSLADAILRFLESKTLRDRLGRRAKLFAQKFTTDNLSKEFIDIMESAMK